MLMGILFLELAERRENEISEIRVELCDLLSINKRRQWPRQKRGL